MHQIPVAVHASLFITRSCKNHRPVRQHGSSFVGHVENVTMTFLTLIVLKRKIGLLALQLMVVPSHIFCEMNKDIFYSMSGFCIKKFKGVMGSR